MDTYKIIKINDNGSVDVEFSCDGITQNISGLSVYDAKMLDEELIRYAVAYKSGKNLQAQKVTPSAEVTKMVGKVAQVDVAKITPVELPTEIAEEKPIEAIKEL